MEHSSSTDVLLAVMLNGFARHAAGQPLSDLEAVFTNVFSHAGFTAGELSEMGQAFSDAEPEVRERLFPGRFSALGAEGAHPDQPPSRRQPGRQLQLRELAQCEMCCTRCNTAT
ncbi:hypothetical protein [Streptomyces sp. XY006]|uniref:hypothetical protein n=1 Tax=Streptomyces sp. XY006 TaxID=2021410 RepID=UPI00117C8F20|nr:hypothetical protein [Streptomyces sp. XY006]